MVRRRIKNLLQHLIHHAADGHGLLTVCLGLAFAGTMTAAYPVTAVVVSATLLAPLRWRQIALATTVGSALGATLLVAVFHYLGWTFLYDHFPDLANHPTWHRIMAWSEQYGVIAVFFIAATPLPQTPALIFFGIARQDYVGVFIAMLSGKALKYGLFAWLAARFPQRFARGMGNLFRWSTPAASKESQG